MREDFLYFRIIDAPAHADRRDGIKRKLNLACSPSVIDEVDIGDPRLLLLGTDPSRGKGGSEPGVLLPGGGGEERPPQEKTDRQCERRTESEPVRGSDRPRVEPPEPEGTPCTLIPQGNPELPARLAEQAIVRLDPHPVCNEGCVEAAQILIFLPAPFACLEMLLQNRLSVGVRVAGGGEEEEIPVFIVCHIASFN